MKLLSAIEHFLLGIRDFFWNYPDNFILEENSFVRSLRKNYLRARPFSHALFVLLIFFSVTSIVFSDISAILRIDKATFIEGVIVGKDENDQIQKVLWINPLIVTNTQIKRDLSELVYEPLLHVNQDNEVQLVLAESYANLGGGKSYRFKLRENVFWHDGKKFTSEDVVETFKLLQSLEFGNQTSSVYSKAAAKINIKKIDDYRFEFSLKDQNTIIPNFFEIISFKVLPAHLIKGLNSSNIIYAEQKINSNPIGTGPFIVGPLNLEEIELKKNKSYYNNVPKLEKMIFRLYKDQEQAVSDLKTGQIHALTGVNSDSVQELSVIPNLKIYKSNVIYNQYWGLYFNLADQNKSSVKEVKVRQAISSAINKNFINEALVGSAIEAKGPIPETSFAFSKSEKYVYNIKSAKTLLDRAGWKVVKGQKYRMSSKGVVLELNLVYVKNIDRDKLVEVIQRDLAAVGIKVNPVAKTISEVNNDYVLPGFFDILLYGVSTFIDPDRYELFHSSQIGYPNLNISSYKSKEETVVIKGGKKQRVPEVDYLLEKGRSVSDKGVRKIEYENFQEIVMEELPVIYLYHPVYTYVVNKRVAGLILEDMVTLEDRYNEVNAWYISV